MPILTLQRRLREAGRIRIGDRKGNRNAPRKLDTFRLTSSDRTLLEHAAALYGGTVEKWEDQWEIYTKVAELPVIVPPSEMAFEQWMELWSGGGCLRRCNGIEEQLHKQPCVCTLNPDLPAKERCTPHTRLSVMLRDLPGIGVWRIESQGFYAATELAGSVQVCAAAAERGQLLPGRLLLSQRTARRDGKTTRFAVPVLDFNAALAAASEETAAVPSFTPLPAPEPVSIAQQLDVVPVGRAARSNAAEPIRRTGLEPRKRAAAAIATTETAGGDEPPEPAEPRRTRPKLGLPGSHGISPPDPRPVITPLPYEPPARARDEEPPPWDDTPDGPPPPADDTAQRARTVARWLREAGIDDQDRPKVLAAFCAREHIEPPWTSAKQVPTEHLAKLRAATVQIKRGLWRVDDTPDGPTIVELGR